MVRSENEADLLLQKVAVLLEEAIANGDTLTAIAERSGIAQQRLSEIKLQRGAKPGLATVGKIAKTLGYRVIVDIKKS